MGISKIKPLTSQYHSVGGSRGLGLLCLAPQLVRFSNALFVNRYEVEILQVGKLMPRLITHKRSPQGNTTIFLHSSLHCNLLLSRWSYRSIWIPMSRILTISRKVSISYSHPFLRLPASSWSSCSIIHGAILVTLRIWIRNNQKLRRSPKPTATVGEKRRCNRVCLN